DVNERTVQPERSEMGTFTEDLPQIPIERRPGRGDDGVSLRVPEYYTRHPRRTEPRQLERRQFDLAGSKHVVRSGQEQLTNRTAAQEPGQSKDRKDGQTGEKQQPAQASASWLRDDGRLVHVALAAPFLPRAPVASLRPT